MQKLAHQLTQAQFAEWMAADIDARRKGGPNCQAKYLELADQLPREIVAETKEKVIEVWSRLERELAPPMPAFMRELSPRKTYQELLQETLAKARDKTEPEASFFGSAAQPEAAPEPKDKPSEEQPKKLGVEEVAAKGIALLSASQRVQQWQEAYIPLDEYLVAMNERHAVIANVGGKCRVVEWVPSELDEGVLVPSFQSKTDFINRYAHRQVGFTRKGDPLTLGAWWFEHPDRADHRGVVFKPGAPYVIIHREGGSWLNLWRGWGVTPERGKWPLLRNHVEQVLSGGDPKLADYNIRWTAWGFQHPDERAEAALVFRGMKGSGKGIYLGTIRTAYGAHGLHITHTAHLTGQFNAHLLTCLYLYLDEAYWAGDKQGEAVLKGVLTERPAMFTKKGMDSVPGVNRVKASISSNSSWVVPASQDERRFAVTDVNNRYAVGNAPEEERKRYFGAIARELKEGGTAAMLYDMLQMNLGDWHPREIPTTAGLMRQKKESLRGHFQWFEAILQSGTLPRNEGRPNRILTSNLIAYVIKFRGLEYETEESIASFLYGEMNFSPELAPQGNRFRAQNGGPRGWHFPPLPELRDRWETKFGGRWPWHEEIEGWRHGAGWRDETLG